VGTGLIFAAVVIAWAVFLVPWALRRYDEATRTRSVDKFSKAIRLLGRAERSSAAGGGAGPDRADRSDAVSTTAAESSGADDADSAHEVHAADVRGGAAGTSDAADVGESEVDAEAAMYPDSAPSEAVAARRNLRANHVSAPVDQPHRPSRAAARAAAQRRRRVLLILFGVTALVGALAAVAMIPLWSGLIPAALVVAFLALCRWQVRREDDAIWDRRRATESSDAEDESDTGARSAAAEDSEAVEGRQAVEADAEPVGDAELAESTAVAVTVSTDDGHSLWDPLPVTLPTYVSKAKATRTVRTIDLGQPDAWTSGHVEGEQTALPSDATASGADADDDNRRAVGD
jgi:hypothetical protein